MIDEIDLPPYDGMINLTEFINFFSKTENV